MDFPLSLLFTLTFSILGSVTLEFSLLAGRIKITLFKTLEEVLQKQKE